MNSRAARKTAGGVLLLLLAVVLAYSGALAGPFQFDDYNIIVDNAQVHGVAAWWQSMPGIRPLLKLSHSVNWSLSPDPWGFHLVNVLLHAINALLVWAVAMQWQRALAPQADATAGWWVGLVFALHPATTEAVTYVSGRSLSLMAVFLLASLWLLATSETQARPRLRAWSALLFAIALGVRETAVVLPLLWLAFAWFRGDTLGTGMRSLRWHGGVLALAILAAMVLPGYARFFDYSLGTRDFGDQLLGQAQAHAHLFAHTLLGLRTNIDPDLRVPVSWDLSSAMVGVALGATLVLAVASRRRWPWLGFGIAWYLLQLAPGNSLLPRFDLANDRHLYLALPGAALVLVVPLLAGPWRRFGQVALLLLALLLALATHRRNLDYGSEARLWQATLRDSPRKARPWTNLGWVRQSNGDLVGARRAYECALELDPNNEQARINLALLPTLPQERRSPGPACLRPTRPR